MLVGDFNGEESESCLSHSLKNTMPRTLNPSCIDLSIMNSPLSFQSAISILMDFHISIK